MTNNEESNEHLLNELKGEMVINPEFPNVRKNVERLLKMAELQKDEK